MGIFTPKCQACGQKNPEVVQHRNGMNLCPNCVGFADQHAAKLSAVVLSTGEIGRPYETVQVLMHIGTGLDGWDNVFARTMTGLKEDALKLGADAILNRVQIRLDHEAIPYAGSGSGTLC